MLSKPAASDCFELLSRIMDEVNSGLKYEGSEIPFDCQYIILTGLQTAQNVDLNKPTKICVSFQTGLAAS